MKEENMSKLQISTSIAMLLNDHAPWVDESSGDDHVECCCGDSFPYMSRWSLHAAQQIVDKILGGAI
jgi:acetone carboxylase gamma subunit